MSRAPSESLAGVSGEAPVTPGVAEGRRRRSIPRAASLRSRPGTQPRAGRHGPARHGRECHLTGRPVAPMAGPMDAPLTPARPHAPTLDPSREPGSPASPLAAPAAASAASRSHSKTPTSRAISPPSPRAAPPKVADRSRASRPPVPGPGAEGGARVLPLPRLRDRLRRTRCPARTPRPRLHRRRGHGPRPPLRLPRRARPHPRRGHAGPGAAGRSRAESGGGECLFRAGGLATEERGVAADRPPALPEPLERRAESDDIAADFLAEARPLDGLAEFADPLLGASPAPGRRCWRAPRRRVHSPRTPGQSCYAAARRAAAPGPVPSEIGSKITPGNRSWRCRSWWRSSAPR